MRVLAIAACFLLINGIDCWARRRRLPDNKKRDVSSVELSERSVEVNRVVSHVSLEDCVENVPACGFTIKCSCCSAPSFLSCGATGLIGSPAIRLLQRRRRSDDLDRDEAGCQLRSVVYNDQEICLPGNVASMMAVVHQSTDGDCYPVYPLNCDSVLNDSIVYWQYFYVPAAQVQNTLTALSQADHRCYETEHDGQGGVKCAI